MSRRRISEPVKKQQKKSKFALEFFQPDKNLPKGYLSHTQISMYLRCPKQYEFRYIKDKKCPPGVSLVEGICHHEAVEMDNEHKFNHGSNLKPKIVIEKFTDEFLSMKNDVPKSDWINSGETVDGVIKQGELMLLNYTKNIAESIIPIALPEKKVEIEIAGIPVMAFIDVEIDTTIIDYKVSKQSKNQNDVDNDVQLSICSLATQKEGVAFCNFTKTKNGIVNIIESTRDNGDYLATSELVVSVADAIKKGSFPMCDPSNSFPCSKRFCGYWGECRGKFYRGK